MERAIGDDGLTYPVAQDNDYATWTAYGNQYWPANYLIDARGRVRLVHFGEGSYAETERAIRSLLAEAGQRGPGRQGEGRAETPDPASPPPSPTWAQRAAPIASRTARSAPARQSVQSDRPGPARRRPSRLRRPWSDQRRLGDRRARCQPRAQLPGAPRVPGHRLAGQAATDAGAARRPARSRTRSPARTSTAARRRLHPAPLPARRPAAGRAPRADAAVRARHRRLRLHVRVAATSSTATAHPGPKRFSNQMICVWVVVVAGDLRVAVLAIHRLRLVE